MIPPASFELSNSTGNDIFQYFRDYYNVSNPHEAGIININASSTTPPGGYNRSTVDILISTPGKGRWASLDIENSSITIDFLKNSVNLVGYTFSTSHDVRFINSWDIYGIYKDQMYLLDSRRNTPLCSNSDDFFQCIEDDEKSFIVNTPGFFQKFRIVHIGQDSLSSFYFSLSQIKFYGSVNPVSPCSMFLERNQKTYSPLIWKNFKNNLLYF